MHVAARFACLAVIGALTSCANLSPMKAGVCGNGVVEPEAGEDCDLFPEAQCRPPGSIGECRFDCALRDDGTRPDCPAGWGCGHDDICRQPSGSYVAAGSAPIAAQSQIATGDFDGDKFVDLLVSNNQAMTVWYSDEKGELSSHVGIPASSYAPAVGDLSNDGLDDVTLIYDGLIVGRGKADETIQPTVSSAYVLPADGRVVLMNARPTEYDAASNAYVWPGDEIVFLLGNAVAPFVETPDPNDPIGALMPGDAADIVGDVQVGDLYESEEESPCDEMAVAFSGKSWIWVYTPCRVTAQGKVVWNESKKAPGVPISLPKVDLPAGVTAGMTLLADLNGDSHLDLLVNPSLGGGGDAPVFAGVAVAFGNGTGTFHSDLATLPAAPATGDNQASLLADTQWSGVIAAGNLDGDSCADIVTSYGVFVTRPSCPGPMTDISQIKYRQIVASGLDSWEFGRIGDLNANGIPDLVVGNSTIARLMFFNGAGDGIFNAFEIPLEAPASNLTIGDFDGDLISDVAFKQAGPHGTVSANVETGDSLAVSFGNGFGAPSSPVNMGRLARIQQVAGGNLAGFYPDGIYDIVVISKSEDATATSAAVLPGASDRRMFAPFPLTRESDDATYKAIAVTLGHFDGDADGHADIAAVSAVDKSGGNGPQPVVPGGLGAGGDVHLWVVPVTGEASLDASMESRSDKVTSQDVYAIPLLAAVDLGSPKGGLDGTDELVALSTTLDPTTYMPGGTLLVAHIEEVTAPDSKVKKTWVAGSAQPLPMLFTGQQGGFSGGAAGGAVSTKGDVWYYAGDIEVGDIDNDGDKDIVALGLNYDPTVLTGLSTSIVLFRNDQTGTLDAGTAVVFPNPEDENPAAIALLNADSDPELEIAVAESDHGYVGDFDLAEGKIVNLRRINAIHSAQSLVSADFDGDGIDDLAEATSDRAILLLGKAVVE